MYERTIIQLLHSDRCVHVTDVDKSFVCGLTCVDVQLATLVELTKGIAYTLLLLVKNICQYEMFGS